MKSEKYICISCGNMITVFEGKVKPCRCPVCNNNILQLVSEEKNPAYRFMVPWDISQYNADKKKPSSIFNKHSELINNDVKIGYF
ncbi:MAG: hypothetical protein KJ571_01440 [Bacteroidetes bacterium]|nr:hypothetical protein [Bacteroidota bacterium]